LLSGLEVAIRLSGHICNIYLASLSIKVSREVVYRTEVRGKIGVGQFLQSLQMKTIPNNSNSTVTTESETESGDERKEFAYFSTVLTCILFAVVCILLLAAFRIPCKIKARLSKI
jgi:hypothetical protein